MNCYIGSISAGLTSVNVSTLEKRYSFSSTLAGLLVGLYDLTVVIGIIYRRQNEQTKSSWNQCDHIKCRQFDYGLATVYLWSLQI